MSILIRELSNGIRVVAQVRKHSPVVQCGYICNTGTRDEGPTEHGIAHFLEHMIFKGTQKRKAWHILNSIDALGGELNAYTSREKTCYYATITKQHFAKSFDLLTDILFNSTFPEKEIEKEVSVVSDEIDMYMDNPEESIYDDFENLIFPNHGLGIPILGTKESIATFSTEMLKNFQNRQYNGSSVVFSVAGNINMDKLEKLSSTYLEPMKFSSERMLRVKPIAQMGQEKIITRPIHQTHMIMGGEAFPLRQSYFLPFLLLNHLLGGESMNSRLNVKIREKYGLVYSIYSFQSSYFDTGIWGIYAGCDKTDMPKVKKLIWKELDKLKFEKLTDLQLLKLKKQYIGGMTITMDSLYNQMISNGKNLVDFGTAENLKQMIEMVNQVTSEDIQYAANLCFDSEKINTVIYEPIN